MLKIYNTLTREKEIFQPIHKDFVGMYVCGPTVYDYCHLGHAKTVISFDVIRKWLEYEGYKVFYISNITDVGHIVGDVDMGEDKIAKRARERKVQPMELVDFYIKSMWQGFDALKVARPNVAPRATGHINEMIEAIKIILKNGYAYEVKGNVYFDLDRFLKSYPETDFGKLSHRKIKQQLIGVRKEVAPGKKNPYDFALWKKASPEHLMQWSSPWGKGFPGWHIECTVMSTKYLGQPFDIHGGAIELAILHHECEIAQAEALNGKKFVNYWVHTGLLNINGEKMSKSKGNFITIQEILREYSPETVRMLIIQTHYRKPLNYSKKAAILAQKRMAKINHFYHSLEALLPESGRGNVQYKSISKFTREAKNDFKTAMEDDFNTPRALSVLLSYISKIIPFVAKGIIKKVDIKGSIDFINEVDKIFGILTPKKMNPGLILGKDAVQKLVAIREKFRLKKEYKTADEIRKTLEEIGVLIEDTPQGPKVELKEKF